MNTTRQAPQLTPKQRQNLIFGLSMVLLLLAALPLVRQWLGYGALKGWEAILLGIAIFLVGLPALALGIQQVRERKNPPSVKAPTLTPAQRARQERLRQSARTRGRVVVQRPKGRMR